MAENPPVFPRFEVIRTDFWKMVPFVSGRPYAHVFPPPLWAVRMLFSGNLYLLYI